MAAYDKLLAFFAAVACSGWAATATAQQHDEGAQALFDSGREAMHDRDYERACQLFLDSNELEPAVGAQLNLANCEERLGKITIARELFHALQEKLPLGDDRLAIVRERAAALDLRQARLILVLAPDAPPDITVHLDGIAPAYDALGVTLPVDPGEHEVVVFAPGRLARGVRFRLEDGETKRLELVPGVREGISFSVAAPTRPVTRQWWFWTGVGAVVVAGTAMALAVALGGGSAGQASPYQGSAGSLRGP